MPRKCAKNDADKPDLPMGVEIPDKAQEVKPPQHGRQSAAPICPYCSKGDREVRCVAGSSTPMFTYYYCPNESCAYSEKRQRPRLGQAILEPDEDFSAR